VRCWILLCCQQYSLLLRLLLLMLLLHALLHAYFIFLFILRFGSLVDVSSMGSSPTLQGCDNTRQCCPKRLLLFVTAAAVPAVAATAVA
jgi:hypothetical protein